MSVMIGIDPHKGSHTAVAVDEGEEAIAEMQVRATRAKPQSCWVGRTGSRSVAGRSNLPTVTGICWLNS
jgi:hypothetical protein